MKHRALIVISLCAGLLALPACGPSTPTRVVPAPATTVAPAPTPSAVTPDVTRDPPTVATVASPTAMTEWQSIGAGVEYILRRERLSNVDDWVTLVRVDLGATALRVHYA